MELDLQNYTQSRISPFDVYALSCLAEKIDKEYITVLEIGSWMGAGSTQVLARYAHRIVCVDTWMGNDNPEHKSIVSQIDPFQIFSKNISPFKNKVISIRTHSDEIPALLKDESFDLIFIDGDHSYVQTKNDIQNCLPKLRKGGIISGHDCEGRVNAQNREILSRNLEVDHLDSIFPNFKDMHPGVIVAVDEMFDEVELFADKTNIIILDTDNNKSRLGYSSIWYTRT